MRAVVLAIAVALVVGGAGGYVLAQHRAAHISVLSGRAYVGLHQASVEVDGWTYGVEGSVPTWIDASGGAHDTGWPSCLDKVGSYARIRFGAIPLTDPDGVGTRVVVWVDCRG